MLDYCIKVHWKEFLHKYYYPDIKACKFVDSQKRVKAIVIDYMKLAQFSIHMAEEVVQKPKDALNEAVLAMQELDPSVVATGVVPEYIVRVSNLPMKTRIRDIRTANVGTLVSMDCIVRKASDVYPRVSMGAFECARCGEKMYLSQEGEGKFIEPAFCKCNEDKKAVFRLLYKESTWVDYQRMKAQELPDELRGGEQPQDVEVDIMNEMVGWATPGDRIILNGIVTVRQIRNKEGKTVNFEPYLEANYIEYKDDTFDEVELSAEDIEEIKQLLTLPPEELRATLISSIAPSIYGYDEVKEACLLSLLSGVQKNLPDGTRIRGDIHILLVGDPGIAKSQILRYVIGIAPRGVYASGKSASAAGLTAAATKDEFDGQWTLEAGAMVQANKGIVGVDEMDKMNPMDRASIHEAMEQQEIHVAKAGILATLKTQCALIGAANPKLGRFDPFENIAEQINMPPSLLSRFDLIFILQDKPDAARDTAISKHILNTHQAGQRLAHKRFIKDDFVSNETLGASLSFVAPKLTPQKLRKFIAYIRGHAFPIMTDDAKAAAEKFYTELRKSSNDGAIPITARQLEGIVRLSEANAKMRDSNEVFEADVERAINLIKHSLKQTSTDAETGRVDIDILTVGVGKSQRARIKTIKEVIKELESKDVLGTANLKDIVERAMELGIKPDTVEKEIDKLKEIGEVIWKGGERYQTTG